MPYLALSIKYTVQNYDQKTVNFLFCSVYNIKTETIHDILTVDNSEMISYLDQMYLELQGLKQIHCNPLIKIC